MYHNNETLVSPPASYYVMTRAMSHECSQRFRLSNGLPYWQVGLSRCFFIVQLLRLCFASCLGQLLRTHADMSHMTFGLGKNFIVMWLWIHLSDESSETNVYHFKDELATMDPIFEYPDSLRGANMPLIIDNGMLQTLVFLLDLCISSWRCWQITRYVTTLEL